MSDNIDERTEEAGPNPSPPTTKQEETTHAEETMGINLGLPDDHIKAHLQPRISVVGVGGAGGNAVNNMIQQELAGVEFLVANTDAQALAQARTESRIQLGVNTTEGLGAGARPEVGRRAAEEALDDISGRLAGSHMCFIAAGMGGGTGTGAAPVIAAQAREMGILTVGVVTKPFQFEGIHRMKLAEDGIEQLAEYVDTLIIIPNQNLFRVANEKTTFADAFKMADDVLCAGVRGITDLMLQPGLINLDFADIRTVMSEMGKAMMGTGEAGGDNRAIEAAEAAISNPLLEDASMRGAHGVLINITGGNDLTLYEVDEAANRIRDEVDGDANIIFGSTFNPALDGTMRVSVVATGIDAEAAAAPRPGNLYDMIAHRESQPVQPAAAPKADIPARPAAPAFGQAKAPAAKPAAPSFAGGATVGATAMKSDHEAEAEMETLAHDAAEAAKAEADPEPEFDIAEPAPAEAPAQAEGEGKAEIEVEPAPEPAPQATRPAFRPRIEDTYIPEAPVEPMSTVSEPKREPELSLSAPKAEPAPAPTTTEAPRPAPRPEPVQATRSAPEPTRPSRSPSLLERVGLKRRKDEPAAAETAQPAGHGADDRSLKEILEERELQASLRFDRGGHTLPEGEDDNMDIPAFLRRQAN